MKEKITYQDILLLLRESKHIANDHWDDIESELSLGQNLSQLKGHKIKNDLWSNIESALEEDKIKIKKVSQRNKILLFMIAFVLVAGFSIWILDFGKQEDEQTFAYKSEIESEKLTYQVDKDENQLEELGKKFINENGFLFEGDKIEAYTLERKRIEEAIEKLNAMKDQYGLDESMMKILAKMEREKASLIKKMISKT